MLVASDYLFNKKWSGHGWINRTSSYGPDILVLGLCYSDINFTESFEAGEWLFSREYDG